MKKIIPILILLFVSAACAKSPAAVPANSDGPASEKPTSSQAPVTATPTPAPAPISAAGLSLPLDNALSRVTKKPFGIKVSPGNSPVSPEKFSGYHTGVDFEITPAEQDTDVTVHAVCSGKLLLKKYATGYGGVAVQSCKLAGQDVTIIYGHLRESSIVPAIGASISAGDAIAVLGKGYSTETDGERKHLHLGIHKGTSVNILGYVQTESSLSAWLNALEYLK